MPIGYSHHRPTDRACNGFVAGHVTVTEAGVELKVGAEPFAGRHSLHVINDSSRLVYIAADPGFDVLGDAFIVFSGVIVAIDLSPGRAGGPLRFYAKTDEGSAVITVTEVN